MVEIRAYDEADREQLLAIFGRNVPKFFGREEQADLERYLDEFGRTHFVAELNGNLVGSGGYVVKENGSDREGWLSWYFIDPEVQGKGVGSRLVNHALQALAEEDVEEIQVNTSQLAGSFFSRFGFEETHRERDYWTAGLDLVAMRYTG